MNKKYSSDIPEKIECEVKTKRILNYSIKETPHSEIVELWESLNSNNDLDFESFKDDHRYCYYSVEIPMGKWSYDGIVNAIIREKYRSDEMEAITNNMAAINAVFMQTLVSGGIVEAIQFLKESAKNSDAEDFRLMQEWRALAKKEAREIFKN